MQQESISHYRIVRKLGEGGMGQVYLAEDRRLGRNVALKILPPAFSEDEGRRQRFQREARAASKLAHPNIAHLYDVGEEAGVHYLVMEYVEGEDLRSFIADRRISPTEVLDLGIQIAEALAEAHANGIIHRDIKPGNIMVSAQGRAKVLDFGLAKFAPSEDQSGVTLAATEAQTETGALLGTPTYMSPEQALCRPVDTRSDVFSLGVVLYQMTTGHHPFEGRSVSETVDRIVHAEPDAVARFNYEAPAGLEWVIRKCLQKDPARRYQTPGELLVDLQNLKRELEGGMAPPALASPGARRWPYALAAVAIVAAVVFTLFLSYRPAEASIQSIAVLPFENRTGDPDLEYLSDGITENLIHSLSPLPNLKVTSRASAFSLKGTEEGLDEVGRRLGVEAVVVGQLLQRGEQVSISTELVDTSENRQLWGQRYDRPLDDLSRIESEIAATIALKVRTRLTPQDTRRLQRRQTDDPAAYRLFLKGRQYHVGTQEEMDKAISYFQQAIEREPLYAMAYAGLAETYGTQAFLMTLEREEAALKAEAAARRALELDPGLAEAHTASGQVKFYFHWDWEGAGEELRRAVELNPGSSNAYEAYSYYLIVQGRYQDAIETARRGAELDPLSVVPVHQLGIAYMSSGRWEQAAAQFEKSLELRPGWVWGYIKRSMSLAHLGRCPEALADAARGDEILAGRGVLSHSWLGFIYGACGQREKALTKLKFLEDLAERRYVDPSALAAIHAAMGNQGQVLNLLERSYEERSPYMVFVGGFPDFYRMPALYDEPRFQELLRKMKLPARRVG